MAEPKAPHFLQFNACSSSGVIGPSKIFLFAGTQLYFGTEKEGDIGRAGMHIM